MKIDCTTCKYGYEDEQLGIPMCHHPKRFSEDCVDFNMHEEKEIKEPEKQIQKGLDVTDFCKPIDPGIAQCIADHSWEMLGEDEKPVPNDLEEAAENIARDVCKQLPNGEEKDGIVYYAILAAIAGAKWQEEKVQETIKLAEDHAFLAGADWQREQMMKEAVEGEIIKDNRGNNVVRAGTFNKEFEYGDKVRIIVLSKED